MFKAQLFVSGQFLGSLTIGPPKGDYRLGCPASQIGYCDKCGRELYRLAVAASDFWRSHGCRCEHCPKRFGCVPGSIWDGYDNDFLNALPEAALKRELSLHLKWLDKEEGL